MALTIRNCTVVYDWQKEEGGQMVPEKWEADETFAGVMSGHRLWKIAGWQNGEPRLEAWGQDTVWAPGEAMEAFCKMNAAHDAPVGGCHCGFWAFKQEHHLPFRRRHDSGPVAIGTVKLWGRVIVTQNGYRAEFAYPERIEVYGLGEKLAGRLAGAYRIEVKQGELSGEQVPEVGVLARELLMQGAYPGTTELSVRLESLYARYGRDVDINELIYEINRLYGEVQGQMVSNQRLRAEVASYGPFQLRTTPGSGSASRFWTGSSSTSASRSANFPPF